jgi:hypothetical protein
MKFTGFNIPERMWQMIDELIDPTWRTFEAGSGLSTKLIEAKIGPSRHVALEHDPNRKATEKTLICKLVGNPPWYDWSPRFPYDLVLIDGPPGTVGRRGILRVVDGLVHDTTVIFVDDIHRPAENQLARELAIRFRKRMDEYRDINFPKRKFACLKNSLSSSSPATD